MWKKKNYVRINERKKIKKGELSKEKERKRQ